MKAAVCCVLIWLAITFAFPVAEGLAISPDWSAEETGTFFGGIVLYWIRFYVTVFRTVLDWGTG